MSAPRGRKTRVFRNTVGDHGRGDFVHFEPAVSLWNFNSTKPQLSRFLQQMTYDSEILVLHLFDVGNDFVLCELFSRLGDEAMLFGKIFRREDILSRARFKQKTSA